MRHLFMIGIPSYRSSSSYLLLFHASQSCCLLLVACCMGDVSIVIVLMGALSVASQNERGHEETAKEDGTTRSKGAAAQIQPEWTRARKKCIIHLYTKRPSTMVPLSYFGRLLSAPFVLYALHVANHHGWLVTPTAIVCIVENRSF